jgi:hypothetical protein
VYTHSLTALLEPQEAEYLRSAFASPNDPLARRDLSDAGRAVLPLLTAIPADEAATNLARLPAAMRDRLDAMSPQHYLGDIRAALIVLLHDRDDSVIPVGESHRLRQAFAGRTGVRYTEFTVFRHLDPTKGKPAPLALAREMFRLSRALYPLFRSTL